MVVFRALSRASGRPPCLPTCWLTWAASPETPLGRLPHPPPRRPPLHQFPDGRAGRPVRLNAGLRHGVSLRETLCSFAPLLAPCSPPPCALPPLRVLPWCHVRLYRFFFGCPRGRALRGSRAPCVCSLFFSVLPLSRRPAPPHLPISPPVLRLSADPACNVRLPSLSEPRCHSC